MVDTVMRFMEVKVCGLLALLPRKPPHQRGIFHGALREGRKEGWAGRSEVVRVVKDFIVTRRRKAF